MKNGEEIDGLLKAEIGYLSRMKTTEMESRVSCVTNGVSETSNLRNSSSIGFFHSILWLVTSRTSTSQPDFTLIC
jgi:hypothetical protein